LDLTGTPFAFYRAVMQRGDDTVMRGALLALLDVGEADPSWVGMFDLVALTALAAALAWLTARAHRTTIMRSPA
jgi:hypothetical protein